METQILEVTRAEAMALIVLVSGTLAKLEHTYNTEKDNEDFETENAKAEITILKGLKSKVEKLEI